MFDHWVGKIPGLGRSPGEGNEYIPVFLPGEFHGQRGLVDYSPWGHSQTRLSDSAAAAMYAHTYSYVYMYINMYIMYFYAHPHTSQTCVCMCVC